jgi:hypothetical protein
VRSLAMLTFFTCVLSLVLYGKSLQPSSATPGFLYTVAKRFEPLAWMDGEERFPAGATVYVQDAQGRHALASDFAASADPAISFDGKTALFAGKRTPQDSWQIWETSLDGGDAKRITNCREACVRPLYLPEGRVVYAEKVAGHFVIQSTTGNGKTLALTHGPESYFPTDVLRDGRILLEAGFPIGEKLIPELYTVYSDGTGVESYRCDHGSPRHSGKQVNSGDIVFADQQGLARFTSALATMTRIAAPQGQYAGDVAETASGMWLLSWRRRTNDSFQLMWWDAASKSFQSASEERGFNVVQPVLIESRAVPNRHPSGLHDWSYANLLCLNAYTSKYKFAAESIHAVRLYTRGEQGKPLLLGTAPVEADGSFFVQIPGDQPLQIELLDSAGKSLKREQGWFWMRGGEQRACVGCHAGPEIAPENAVPQILLKSTTPADMTHPAAATSAGGH